jgi:D-inositol-3-phosphate glycosyltransferase
MISFVWSAKQPLQAGRGGSENYTAGQIRELARRGIPTRVLTLGFGEDDGREDWPDIQFEALSSKEELSELDDTLVFVTYPIDVPTRRPAYAILHCPPERLYPPLNVDTLKNKHIITASRFAAKLWSRNLHTRSGKIPTSHPFAEECFSLVERSQRLTGSKTRILFAGRLLPDKGIYTLLAALHMDSLKSTDYELTVTDAAADTDDGQIIKKLLEVHPNVNLIPARRSPEEMAELMANHDIVVAPTTNIFWQELFGIVSVEAQHAGCRVVASDSGGLPETDCGGLLLVKPDDPAALASGLAKAAMLGPLTVAERMYASTKFTRQASVDALLTIMAENEKKATKTHAPLPLLHKQGSLVREQLDVAISTFSQISQLGLQLTREQKLAQRNARNTQGRPV